MADDVQISSTDDVKPASGDDVQWATQSSASAQYLQLGNGTPVQITGDGVFTITDENGNSVTATVIFNSLPVANAQDNINFVMGVDIHSIFSGNNNLFCVDSTILKYLRNGTLIQLFAGLTNAFMNWCLVGNYVFYANGFERGCIYIPTKIACSWGMAVPTVAPTVVPGSAGSHNATFSCYYRYRVTLPDDTIILTALSPMSSIEVVNQTINWTVPLGTFTGAKTVETDLFRTAPGLASIYLVTTLPQGTDTFVDTIEGDVLSTQPDYEETGYWPPPDKTIDKTLDSNITIMKYYAAADRIFAVIDGDVYWSEAGMYHTFIYDPSVGEYKNVNSVYLAGDKTTAIKIIDENLYFSSPSTWRRLRGKDPSEWDWEDTASIMGAINDKSACETPYGVIYPGIDGHMWIFNGFDSRQILEEFVFTTLPGPEARASFDGRFYRLFYGDPNYPELVVDFYKYPSVPPRIIQSTRTAKDVFYDRNTAKFYLTDGQYIRQGDDPNAEVSMTVITPDIPSEEIELLGNKGMLLLKANTQGDDMIITPYFDGKAAKPLQPYNSSDMIYKERPVPFGDCRVMSFMIQITSSKAFILEEPWLLKKES